MSKPPAPDRFVTIAYVYSPSDLAILQSRLDYEGIRVTCAGRGHASVEPGLTTALGGIRVRVHEVDLADAQAILATLDPFLHRAPLPFGFWPLDLLLFLAIAFFAAGPPPRQPPTYILSEAAARRQSQTRQVRGSVPPRHGRSGPAGLRAGGWRRRRQVR